MTIILDLTLMMLMIINVMIKRHYLFLDGDIEGILSFYEKVAIVNVGLWVVIALTSSISLNLLNIILFIGCCFFACNLVLYLVVLLYDNFF